VDEARIRAAADALREAEASLLLLGDRALRAEGLELASRIAQKTGVRFMAQGSSARVARGAGRVAIERVPHPVDLALNALAGARHIVLVGATPPVAFFAYPGKPSELAEPGSEIHTLAEPAEDQLDALARLADALDAHGAPILSPLTRPEIPRTAALDPTAIGAVLGSLLPDNAIVCDESITTGRNFFTSTHGAPPHDWLQLSGGAIGLGIPLATGAAIACPDRQVITLQADGSGMYTLQGLWTQARERLKVLTCIWSNRSYATLRGELANVGARNPGPAALGMLSLDDPALDWTSLARGLGVEAVRAVTVDGFADAFSAGLRANGPFLIEVVF
jgi:acetolactate synthase-1/2/3 large subunit